jgi:hypothetical protein
MATFGTFTSGQVLTAAELNSAGAWQAYTPTWTQSATITKTVDWARYTQLGKWVHGSVKMTASSAGTANNKMLVGLPVNASADNFIVGSMVMKFVGGAAEHYWFYTALYDSASSLAFSPAESGNNIYRSNDKRFGQDFTIGGTAKTGVTIASGDIIWIQFSYEAS